MASDLPITLRRASTGLIVGASGLLFGCIAEVTVLTIDSSAAVAPEAGSRALPPTSDTKSEPAVLLPAPTAKDIQSTVGANGCVPGHYRGTFSGTYNSAAWGNGAVPLSIEAVPTPQGPGLEFWLEATANDCGSAEFCADFSVKGGRIRGFANPFSSGPEPRGTGGSDGVSLAIPFEIDFGGELDCSKGRFHGSLLNGCYEVAGLLYRFEGTAPATYEYASSSFTQGQWAVKELAMEDALLAPAAGIGGSGSWSARLLNDGASPIDLSNGLCHM
jgi:hypothetical protein